MKSGGHRRIFERYHLKERLSAEILDLRQSVLVDVLVAHFSDGAGITDFSRMLFGGGVTVKMLDPRQSVLAVA